MSIILNNKDQQKLSTTQEKNTAPGKTFSIDLLIAESRKLIKQGYYKKAYTMLQQHLVDPKSIESVQRIKLCRRIMAASTNICDKLLNKPENHKHEKLKKLLEAGSNYLIHWHNAISNFMVKTSKKFEHLHGLLEEISNSSDDDSQIPILNESQSRRSTRRDSTNIQTPLMGSAHRKYSKYDKQASLLVQILKNQDNREGSSDNILNNSFNDVEGSNVVAEEFTGNEMNTNYQLDEFLGYCVRHLMNYGLFYRKLNMYSTSFRYLDFCYNLTKKVESTLNPNLLDICGRAKIPYGTLHLEFKRYKEAIEIFESALNTFQIELSIRFNQSSDRRNEESFVKHVLKTVKLICVTLLNIAKCHELQLQYSRTLESYMLANWFSKHFLLPEDEFMRFVFKACHKAKEQYASHVEEVAEMERVVFENKEIVGSAAPKEETENKTHFLKLQEQLYKKFGYSELNKRKIPVKLFQSPFFAKRNQKDQLFDHKIDDHNDFLEKAVDASRNPIRELMNSSMIGDSPSKNENMNPYLLLLEDIRRRKEKKLPKKPAGKPVSEGKKSIINQRFTDPTKEKSEIEITEEEERKCIQQLNRNIKIKRPKTASSASFNATITKNTTIGTPKYIDIDHFFSNRVDELINSIDEEKSRPQDFSQVIKNHIYHCKREDFDKKDFEYRRRTLSFLHHEDLGEEKMNFKELIFGGFDKEKRAIETDGFFITTQTQVKNAIQTRVDTSKSLSVKTSPKFFGRKSIKPMMFSSPLNNQKLLRFSEQQENQQIDENPQTEKKISLNSLILKHKDKFGLKQTVNALKEMHRKSKNENLMKLMQQQTTQETEPKTEIIQEQSFDPESLKKIHLMVKDRLTKMMEEVEHETKDDSKIGNRILSNKPIFQQKKPKEKFLKGLDELSNSCRYLSVKKEASKKSLDFANLVRLQMKINPEDRRKNRKRIISKTETQISSTKESRTTTTFKNLFVEKI